MLSQPRLIDLLRDAREALGMPIAFMSRFVDGRQVIEAVDATCPVPFGPGDTQALEQTYCLRMVEGVLPQAIPDTAANPVTAAMPVTAALNIGSYVGVPIVLSDGSVYGTLCAYSEQTRSVNERDAAILSLIARSVARHHSDEARVSAEHDAIRERLAHARDNHLLRSVYQPIVDVTSGNVVSVEALARFEGTPPRRPDEWFADAARVGEGAELELAAIACALEGLDVLPADVSISVNVSAAVVLDPLFAQWLETAPVERLILELTEHEQVSEYACVNAALASARARGLRLAVDDAGAGYASMRHTLMLKPEVLKLDISLIRGLDTDADKRALCRALITFAASLGARVVAEGVETAAELVAVRRLGVDLVQGYLLAKPAPLKDLQFSGYAQAGRSVRRGSSVAPETEQMIRELHHAGASPATIAARLNKAGEESPRGVRWHRSSVEQILKRPGS